MVRGDKTVKLLTITLYFLEVVLGICVSLLTDRLPNLPSLYIAIIVMVVALISLSHMNVDTEKQVRAFVFVSMLVTTATAVFDAIMLDRSYVFVVLQMLYLLCNIPGFRQYVFTMLTAINVAIIIVLALVLNMFNVLDCVILAICVLIAGWVATIYTESMSRMMRIVKEQDQSRDDMIELMESRFAEEKGANTAKSAFLANMSHEIRTPINAIVGMNTMILRDSREKETIENAQEIENASQTLLSLINDILDISKVESGKMDIVPVEYDFSSLVNDVYNMISVKAKGKGLELKLDIDEKIPNRLFGDDVRIRQILINLLNNGVKYTEKGSVTLRVSGQVSDNVVLLKYSVVDTGIGIKKEDMTRLFTKFERLDVVKNRNVEGTGLGMAITQKLLGLMDSKLDVESTYGEGSSFSFYLVQKVVDPAPVGDINKRHAAVRDADEHRVRFIAPDAKILVVDDNAINRKVFTKLLQRIKIQVDEAESGFAALNMMENKKFDIVFLDHMMPEMDGLETLKRLREDSVNPNIDTPIIALTANAIAGSKEFYLEAGFDDYLSKPIVPANLEKMIYSLLPKEHIEKFPGDEA